MSEFNSSTFQRVRELFDQACDLDSVSRSDFLNQECDDEHVRVEVESLLKSHDLESSQDAALRETPRPSRSDSTAVPQVELPQVTKKLRKTRLSKVTQSIGTQGQSALWIILALLILSGFVAWAYVNMQQSLRKIREEELRLFITTNVAAIENHIELEKAKVRIWSEKNVFREAAQTLVDASSDGELQVARQTIRTIIDSGTEHSPDYLLFSEANKVLAASANYGDVLGKRTTAEGAALVTRVFENETAILNPTLQEDLVSGHAVKLPRPQMSIALPIISPGDDGAVIGAMVLRGIGLEDRFFELLQNVRAGESGETYAFDREGTMISESRFNDQLREMGLIDDQPDSHSSLKIQVRDPGGNMTTGFRPSAPLATRPLTKMASFATAGENGFDLDGYHDYRGVDVVGAWQWLPEYDFGVTTEIDYEEMYRPMRHLNMAFGAISTLVLASIGVIGYSSLSMARLRRKARNVKQVGQYSLGRLLGEGGMGQVFLAQHALLKRPTAVKLLHPDQMNDETHARFEREVQLASQLSHPNTIEIYDYGHTPEGVFYYAMEYLTGINLDDLIRREGPIPAARVAHILAATCRSLREAHAQGLVHRDIKPQNIMLCQRGGESDVVKVLDFGLVKPVSSMEATKITKTMGVIGTPLYMAPERLRDPESNDPKSDIYSLGAVGFNLLTGHDIYHDVSDVDVYYHVINTVPPRASDYIADLPPALDQLIADCLAKDPNERPASVVAMLEILAVLPGEWTDSEANAWWENSRTSPAPQ